MVTMVGSICGICASNMASTCCSFIHAYTQTKRGKVITSGHAVREHAVTAGMDPSQKELRVVISGGLCLWRSVLSTWPQPAAHAYLHGR